MLLNFKGNHPIEPNARVTTRVWEDHFQFYLNKKLRSAQVRILYAYPTIELLDVSVSFDREEFQDDPRLEAVEMTAAHAGIQEFRTFLTDERRKEEERKRRLNEYVKREIEKGKGIRTGVPQRPISPTRQFNFKFQPAPNSTRKGRGNVHKNKKRDSTDS